MPKIDLYTLVLPLLVLVCACGDGRDRSSSSSGSSDSSGSSGSSGGSGGDGGGSSSGPPPTCPALQAEPAPVDGYFASDGQHIYYAEDVEIRRVPVDGGPVEVVLMHTAKVGSVLKIDGGDLFFQSDKSIFSVPKDGGVPKVVAEFINQGQGYAVGPSSIVRLETDTSWIMFATPRDGGADTKLWEGIMEPPASMVVDATSVYWLTSGGLVRSMSLSGGETLELSDSSISIPANKYGEEIAQDDTHLYWSTFQQAQDVYPIFKVAKTGGKRETLLDEVLAAGVKQFGGMLYFIQIGSSKEYRIGKLTTAGTKWGLAGCFAPEEGASGAPTWRLTVDEGHLYAVGAAGNISFPREP